MHKVISKWVLLMTLCFSVAGCDRNEIKKTNKLITERQEGFSSGGNSFATVKCPYGMKELKSILNLREKGAWPKIKVTATFGVLPNCKGCVHCGCCIGFCIQIEKKSSLAYSPLTTGEIAGREILFDFIDLPDKKHIVLIPNSNVDNGDRHFYVEHGVAFSDEVNRHIGRKIRFVEGKYEILYPGGYPHGLVIVKTL